MVISVEWNIYELRIGPRSQADIVVAEELLVILSLSLSLSALSAIYPFGGQASLDVTQASAIAQLVSASFAYSRQTCRSWPCPLKHSFAPQPSHDHQ